MLPSRAGLSVNIGAFKIRIGFWCISFYNYNKEPRPKQYRSCKIASRRTFPCLRGGLLHQKGGFPEKCRRAHQSGSPKHFMPMICWRIVSPQVEQKETHRWTLKNDFAAKEAMNVKALMGFRVYGVGFRVQGLGFTQGCDTFGTAASRGYGLA